MLYTEIIAVCSEILTFHNPPVLHEEKKKKIQTSLCTPWKHIKSRSIAPRSGRFIHDTRSIRGWEGRTAGPDALEKTVSYPHQDSNPRPSSTYSTLVLRLGFSAASLLGVSTLKFPCAVLVSLMVGLYMP